MAARPWDNVAKRPTLSLNHENSVLFKYQLIMNADGILDPGLCGSRAWFMPIYRLYATCMEFKLLPQCRLGIFRYSSDSEDCDSLL